VESNEQNGKALKSLGRHWKLKQRKKTQKGENEERRRGYEFCGENKSLFTKSIKLTFGF